MNIVILGLSKSSSQGEGHAAIYRGLVRELNKQGHHILFLERAQPLIEGKADPLTGDFCEAGRYRSLNDLQQFTEQVREADMVMLSSFVPEGTQVAEWLLRTAKGIKAFYDLDTPLTLAKLKDKSCEYLHPNQIPQFDLYLSVSGGPALAELERTYGATMARALYRSVDATRFYPEFREKIWDLGYLGNYSEDNQQVLDKLMLEAATNWQEGRFVVAGSNFPGSVDWPANTKYTQLLQTVDHRKFYNSLRFAQHITQPEMASFAYAPSRKLLEAAACGTPIISNYWEGLEDVFHIGTEVLVSRSAKETLQFLREISKSERKLIGERARKKILSHHTAACRAKELISFAEELLTLDGDHETYNSEVMV